ncbi:hypothetical protein CAP36_07010 [Chitinophagaceae bacterium IBVUCB2]|nr:hypothetical protein CAP36_07010 [Chitinophagaceae bacterium IBVUCB2]
MKKNLLAILVVSFLLHQTVKAQYYYYNNKYYENAIVVELGGSFGFMNSLTDLGGKKGIGKNFIKDLRWQTAKPCYSLYAIGMYQNMIGVRLEGTFGSIAGYDSILKNVASSTSGRYERNLSFRSKITDIQLALEIHPLYFKNYSDDEPPVFSPYAVAGLGYYSFNPEANLNGQWYALQPLRTEGQGFREYREREPYKLNQINVALGLGIKYEVNSMINARLEAVHRILFTDYLDDVSTTYIDPALFYNYLPANRAAIAQQLYNRRDELNPSDVPPASGDQRGDPRDNDAFFTIQLKVGIVIGRQRR